MKTNSIKRLVISTCALVGTHSTANAAVVLQPTSASTDMGEYFSASRTRNQSGLSSGYTNLVTDFDNYLGLGPTAYHGGGDNIWGASLGVRSGNFDFDLGGTYLVSAVALWNLIGDPSAVRQVTILLDDNASFSSPSNLGTFTASNSLGSGSNTAAQVFTFSDTPASFVRFQILNTWSATSAHTAFNEVAFRVSPIPEPSIAAFGILGCFLLFLHRSRKDQKA